MQVNDVIIYNSSQKENFAMDIRLKINKNVQKIKYNLRVSDVIVYMYNSSKKENFNTVIRLKINKDVSIHK